KLYLDPRYIGLLRSQSSFENLGFTGARPVRGEGGRMKIVCVGGGPAGLYFASSMKLRNPSHDITVYERNRPDDTFGWAAAFADQTMANLVKNDPVSANSIAGNFIHWDDIDVHLRGQCIRSTGHGFIGIGRKQLLLILQNRARELGVTLAFQTPVGNIEAMHPD